MLSFRHKKQTIKNVANTTFKKLAKKFYGSFYGKGSTASRLHSHSEEIVYFSPQSLNLAQNLKLQDWESSVLKTRPLFYCKIFFPKSIRDSIKLVVSDKTVRYFDCNLIKIGFVILFQQVIFLQGGMYTVFGFRLGPKFEVRLAAEKNLYLQLPAEKIRAFAVLKQD